MLSVFGIMQAILRQIGDLLSRSFNYDNYRNLLPEVSGEMYIKALP